MYCMINYVHLAERRIWSRRKNRYLMTNNIFNEAKHVIEKPRLTIIIYYFLYNIYYNIYNLYNNNIYNYILYVYHETSYT